MVDFPQQGVLAAGAPVIGDRPLGVGRLCCLCPTPTVFLLDSMGTPLPLTPPHTQHAFPFPFPSLECPHPARLEIMG